MNQLMCPVIPKSRLVLGVIRRNQAFARAGITETGHDTGPEINRIEQVWGLEAEPFCAMGQYYNFVKEYMIQANMQITADNIVHFAKALRPVITTYYLTFDPSCGTMMEAAHQRGQWREFMSDSDVTRIHPGDYIIYDWHKNGDNPERHIGQFVMYDGRQMHTVEWNTSNAGAEGNNDPGGGCYEKQRDPDPNVILGTIAWSVMSDYSGSPLLIQL